MSPLPQFPTSNCLQDSSGPSHPFPSAVETTAAALTRLQPSKDLDF